LKQKIDDKIAMRRSDPSSTAGVFSVKAGVKLASSFGGVEFALDSY
jgi:hypothetical protein